MIGTNEIFTICSKIKNNAPYNLIDDLLEDTCRELLHPYEKYEDEAILGFISINIFKNIHENNKSKVYKRILI